MFNLNESLMFEIENASESAYGLPVKKNFFNPKIYLTNGDLIRGCDIFFSYLDP